MSLTIICDTDLHGPLCLKDAEALVARVQAKIEAAKQEAEEAEEAERDAGIAPGGLYLDQHGTAYLALDDRGEVNLWRLHPDGASSAPLSWWRTIKSAELRPVTAKSGCVLTVNGIEAHT